MSPLRGTERSQHGLLTCLDDLVGLLVAYTAAMFILYTVAPILYRMASSAYYNLSLLSSDFYGLLFGLFLFVRILPSHRRFCHGD